MILKRQEKGLSHGSVVQGYGLLFLYLALAFLLRNHQTFFDEGSNLNLASGVLKGLHLYRDLFENHFPLPVYLSAGIIRVAGTSLPLVRLAVLLINAGMLMATMRVSRLYFPVGFAAAVWGFISPYYFGNLLLYDNLASISGLALGAVCFAALARGRVPSRGVFALVTVAGFVAALSSPFFALVTGVALASLLLAPKIPARFVLQAAAVILAPIAAYFVYLAATGALGAFYADAIVFNTTTYQKYTSIPILPLIGKQLLFFDLFNRDWLRSFDPLRFDAVTYLPRFDHWIFSGLFYRIAALAACGLFAWRRNFRTAVFLYLFVALLPLREDDGFHAAPFVFFCLFLLGILIEEARPAVRWLWLTPVLVLAFSGARYVAKHAFQSDFERLTAEALLIREAAQHQEGVRLGHYPYGNYMYYLSGLRPISKYVDYYPWVAEIGRAEVDAELAKGTPVVLAMDVSGAVWNYPNRETLASEMDFARKHLIKENVDWLTVYVSPLLARFGAAGTEAAFTALAAPLEDAPVRMTGAWSRNGAEFSAHGDGTIRIGPFRLRGHSAMALPMMTGRDNHGLSVTVRDAVTGGVLARLDPPPAQKDWWAWRPDLPQDPGLTFVITAENQGTASIALRWPHWLREANPAQAFRPGLYRDGEWRLEADGSKVLHLGGQPGDVPVTGDWDGSGKTKIGIYRSGEWFLFGRDGGYRFGGQPGDVPVTGDWDGSGKTRVGVYRSGLWLLDGTSLTYHFGGQFGGTPGDIPVTGDWDGSGKAKPGIYRPQTGEWTFYGDTQSHYFGGIAGDTPVVGDWNGDGRTKPALFRRGSSWLLDMDGNYKFEDLGTDAVISLGNPGDKPVAGKW